MNKKLNMGIVSFAIIAILVLGTFVVLRNINDLNLEISNVEIDKKEYINTMNSKKYEVTQYFINNYGAKIDSEFWEKDFDGEYPYKTLADKTIDELLKIHSIYSIAKEKGYVDSTEYKDFIERLNNENNLRSENIKQGKPVYGLSKFTEELFLEYETDKIQKLYCNDLNNEGMKISSEEGKKYYDENKDLLFRKSDDFELSFVKVYYGSLGLSKEEVNEIKNHMLEVSKKIDINNSLLSLVEDDEKLKEYFSHETVLSSELSAKAKVMGDVLDIAMNLEKGEVSQVLDENECLYLIEIIDRVKYDYLPFEEVRDNIDKVLREEHYDEIINSNSKNLIVNNNKESIYKFTKKNVK